MRGAVSYFLVVLFYAAVAAAGRGFTAEGIMAWYPALEKPPYTPPGTFIAVAWTSIYVLTALSLIVFIRTGRTRGPLAPVVALYVVNGVINAAWSYVFFVEHLLALAALDALLIALSVLALILLVRRRSPAAAVLLVPYLLWSSFATYLAWDVYRLNSPAG